MGTTREDWVTSVENAWPDQRSPEVDSQFSTVVELVQELLNLHVLLLHNAHGLDDACRTYVVHALDADRPAWAAAGRAVWAQGLLHAEDEESSHLQLVLAELELQRELSSPRPDPPGGPTGPGAAYNNLGDAYMKTRAFESAIAHFRSAVRESQSRYDGRLWLQHLVDHANLSSALVHWALHLQAAARPAEAQRAASQAWRWAQRFSAIGEQYQRADAIALASALAMGALSVIDPDAVGPAHVHAVQTVCEGELLGDDLSAPIAWTVLARVSRIVGDRRRCEAAIERVDALSQPGDLGLLTLARREAALLAQSPAQVWAYTESVALQAEAARRRAVAALQTRTALTGLEEQYQQVCAQRQSLQVQLEAARRTEAVLLHAATHDALTGLPNRRLFDERAQQALRTARQDGLQVAFGLVDLDDLKRLNDEHGHTAGDNALHHVAQALRSRVTPQDTVARLGGDEFAVILASMDNGDALMEWANGLNAELRPLGLSVSVGLCLTPADPSLSTSTLLLQADAQMYLAKQAGKGQAHVQVVRSHA